MASKDRLEVPKPPRTPKSPKTPSRATSRATSRMRRQKSYRSQAESVEFDSLGPIFALPRLPEAFAQFEKGLIRTLDRNLLSDNIEYDDQGPVCALPRLPSIDSEELHTTEKKLVRRVDRRLLPVLGALYAISMIDRANVPNARVAGMVVDLQLDVGYRYTIILLLFFIPRFFFGLPSNILMRKLGSANWLTFISFGWGTVMMSQAFCKTYRTLAICRVIVGLFGAGLFPGCVYLVSCWYMRYEVQKRLAAFYLFSISAGGLSNVLAFGLQRLEGLAGIRGWQWIFIIEGLMIQVIAACAWFFLIDFPDKATKGGFLTKIDAAYMRHRIQLDRGDAIPDHLTWRLLWEHLCDPKLWAFGMMLMCAATPTFAFAYFTPVIVKGMGYSPGVANLLSGPPVLFAVVCAFFFAWLGDKCRARAALIAPQSVICIIGLMMTAYAKSSVVRYFGIFLGNAGCHGNIPAVLAYQSNNIRHQSKRGVGSALQIGFQAIGGIIASTVFRQTDAPTYIAGLWTVAGLQFLLLGLVGTTTYIFSEANKRCDKGTLEKPIEGLEGFRFTL